MRFRVLGLLFVTILLINRAHAVKLYHRSRQYPPGYPPGYPPQQMGYLQPVATAGVPPGVPPGGGVPPGAPNLLGALLPPPGVPPGAPNLLGALLPPPVAALGGLATSLVGGLADTFGKKQTTTSPLQTGQPELFSVPRISLTDREVSTKAALGNGMQDMENVVKNDPLRKLGLEVQKLRLQIIKDPKMLEETMGVLVFDLPKEGSEETAKAKQVERGLADLDKGKTSACADEAKTGEEEIEGKAIENMDPKRVEEMLRAMTLQERIGFDRQLQSKLENEETKLKGEMDYVLKMEKEKMEFAAKQKAEKEAENTSVEEEGEENENKGEEGKEEEEKEEEGAEPEAE